MLKYVLIRTVTESWSWTIWFPRSAVASITNFHISVLLVRLLPLRVCGNNARFQQKARKHSCTWHYRMKRGSSQARHCPGPHTSSCVRHSAAQRILGALPHARGPGELPGRGALRALQEPGPPGAAAACPAPAPRPRYLSLRPRNGAPAAPAPPRRSSFPPPPLFFFISVHRRGGFLQISQCNACKRFQAVSLSSKCLCIPPLNVRAGKRQKVFSGEIRHCLAGGRSYPAQGSKWV